METCEVCDRPEGIGDGMCQRDTMRWAPDEAADCYRIGYEREKARADALAAKVADVTARLGAIFEPGSDTASLDAMLTRLRGHSVKNVAPTDRSRLPRERSAWDMEDGDALWWRFPVVEPPYCGTPLDDDFPDYVTHWTPIHVPEDPTP